MTPDLFRHLVTQARLAPSVHNVQPARWRLDGDAVLLLEDPQVRLAAADPTGHDAAMSLGAALEGMAIAAAQEGLHLSYRRPQSTNTQGLHAVARLTFTQGAPQDALAPYVFTRQSWRGDFAAPTPDDTTVAAGLGDVDCAPITDVEAVRTVARLLDAASFKFTSRPPFRSELLSWMRLTRSHPDWGRDGLNGDAMRLGFVERIGAKVVMGPAFRPLSAIGLAEKLLREEDKTATAAAIIVFHRPQDEDPFESGRAFYRAWLRIEAAGFGAAVLAALADDPESKSALGRIADIPDGHRIVSAFRVGRRPPHAPFAPARRSVDEVIV